LKVLLLSEFHGTWIEQEISILKELHNYVTYIYVPPKYDYIPFFGGFWRIIIFFKKAFASAHASDVIFCWWAFSAAFVAICLGKLFKKPVIINAVGVETEWDLSIDLGISRHRAYRSVVHWVLRNSKKVISISQYISRNVKKIAGFSPSVVYEGIDTEKFTPIKYSRSKDRMILTVATLSKANCVRKGYDTLLKAMNMVLKEISDVKLVIVGEKKDGYPFLKKLAENLGINDSVIFKGKVSEKELIKMYQRCNVFIEDSRQEGFPTVVVEAMACGRPVISSTIPSVKEVIKDYNEGILVPPNNSSELAMAIMKVLNDDDLAKKLSQNARSRAMCFSKEARKKKLQNILNKICLQSFIEN